LATTIESGSGLRQVLRTKEGVLMCGRQGLFLFIKLEKLKSSKFGEDNLE
jgi:hypothetical protein